MKSKIEASILNSQLDFLQNNINVFLKNRDLTQISISTEYGGILMTRDNSVKPTVIKGFAVGTDEDIDDGIEDYEEDFKGVRRICNKKK